jgi:putative DNA primase/helicase
VTADRALELARRFHVFPLDHPSHEWCQGVGKHHNAHRDGDRGKHPACKWSEWSTQDPETVARYFAGNTFNIGIDCGKSGILVVDEDAPDEFDKLCADLRVDIPHTFTVRTGKGRHFYFKQPAGTPHGNKEGALRGYAVNIRGTGGYVVAPGSLHATGVIYETIADTDPTQLPGWLADALNGKTPRSYEAGATTDDKGWWRTGTIPDGKKHFALVAAAGWALRMGYTLDEATPLVREVWSRCEGEVAWDDADARLHDVYDRYEAGSRVEGVQPDGYRLTDVGNAGRLLKLAKGNIRHVHAWGKWIVYRDGRWVIDENDVLVTELAKGVGRGLFKMAATINGDKDERERAWKWAVRSETSGGIAAMVRLARGAPGLLVEHEQLDADPHLLNVRNGTIDLRTGTLRPHDPADLLTIQCPVDYEPTATAPLWQACVERWQPDPTVRTYVQVRAGAGATGKPTETVDVDYGSGGNGKSKFWGAIQHVLGDYAVVPHKSLLVAQRHEQHATVVARLFRKRLAVASETKAADVLDDEQVKNLTGGDRLSGRRMREDPWEFQPTHTLVMFSNHKPAIHGRDEGIWRRLRLVPWEVTIPEDERDPDLADKLALEAPGILRWIVEGARRFLADGLTPPKAVQAATDAYRADEDTIGRFIRDVLTIGDGWVMSSEIKAELEAWCDEQDVDPPRMNEVAEALRGLGCRDGGRKVMKGKRSTIWHGIRVAEIKAETP